MKRLEIACTFDRSDCTQSGYVFSAGRDKNGYYRVYAEYQTRWQGRYTGEEKRDSDTYDDINQAKESISQYMGLSWDDMCDMVFRWETVKKGMRVQ